MTVRFQPGGRAPAPPPLDLVQDFVNTEIQDWNRDYVATPEQLGAWLVERGLLAGDETIDAETFVAARSLRSALRALALANTLAEPVPLERRGALEAALARFPLGLRLVDGRPTLVPVERGAAGALAGLVAIVAEARSRGAWQRMKACREETCGWLFYDGSRNRSSSWCSMRICGGREKARAYRRRAAGRT
jgi:predicted RNA-binding Zn ribbon-like protein